MSHTTDPNAAGLPGNERKATATSQLIKLLAAQLVREALAEQAAAANDDQAQEAA